MSASARDGLEPLIFEGTRGRIFALLHLPPQHNEGRFQEQPQRFPLIVFCHGFTGEHVGPNRLGVELGRAAARAGIALCRYDNVGSGNSDGDFATHTSLSGWMQDLQDVLAFMARHPLIDADRIGTLGLSMGGAVVLLVGSAGGRVKAVGCWSPVVYPVTSFRDTVLGPTHWQRLEAGETVKNFYNKGFALAPQFAADLVLHDVAAAAARIPPLPLWVAHGDRDAVIPVQHARQLKERLGTGLELQVFPGADHVFTDHRPQVVEATVAWFRRHLTG